MALWWGVTRYVRTYMCVSGVGRAYKTYGSTNKPLQTSSKVVCTRRNQELLTAYLWSARCVAYL